MKLQITVSDNIGERILDYSNLMGLSRSQFCSFILGTYIMGLDAGMNKISGIDPVINTFKKESE